jgi:hypothetical protein
MIWFNFEDALLLPFSSMQLRRSQMEPTGIQKILLAIYSLCSKVIHTPLMKILFSFEVLYQYYDLLVGTLASIYNLMIYCFFVLTFTSIIKRLLLLASLHNRASASGQVVQIHPSSVLFRKKPDCIIFNELIQTNNKYIRNLTRVDSLWLPELAPQFYATQN